MSKITFTNVDFYYENSMKNIFTNLSLEIDTNWKVGLVGNNGRGKTTLLKLITKDLCQNLGSVKSDLMPLYFPYKISDNQKSVFEIIKNSVFPFSIWEQEMEVLLKKADAKNLSGQ